MTEGESLSTPHHHRYEVMQDPVITADGHTYERAAIAHWLESRVTSPKTGLPLANTTLIPNIDLKRAIEEHFFITIEFGEKEMGEIIEFGRRWLYLPTPEAQQKTTKEDSHTDP